MKPKAYSYIRFSTLEQKKGDSLRRQIQGAEDWCKANGYTLDDQMRDEGLSAFSGLHKTKGSLGRFLDLVNAGKIEKGSALIVENLDRLSREQPMTALYQFTDMIRAGIRVVTFIPEGDFTEKNLNENFGFLMGAFSDMDQAHKESSKKSKRLKATWEQKRANVDNKKLTGRCPAWLKRSKDWTEYHKIDGRWQIIEKIFQIKLSGKSPRTITKELNRTEGIWKPKNGWRNSYINKILRSRAAIGEYQPHKMIKGKRQPVGDPLPNYFPVIVSPDIFYAVQEQIRVNGQNYHGGRTGKVRNLFSHLAKCGYCGGAMHFVNKGKPPKGGSYLLCDNAKRKNGCKYRSWRYDEFEQDVVRFLSVDIDLAQLLPDFEQIESEISVLQREKSSIQGQLNKVKSEIENLSDTIASTPDKRIRAQLEGKLADRLDEKERFEKQETEAAIKINDLKKVNGNVQERISNVKELFQVMQDLKDRDEDTLIDIRFRLRQMLRNLIEGIKVFPGGFVDRDHVNKLYPLDKRDIYREGIDNKDFRFYQVNLKGCKSFKRGWYPPETYNKLKELERKRKETRVGFAM